MSQAASARQARRSGFTLIEVIVALGLFSLIALAGFTLLDGVIGTRDRLDGRLARLGELQRAMYLVTLDFEAMTADLVTVDQGAVKFQRRSSTSIGAATPVEYLVVEGALHRRVGTTLDQRLIEGVSAVDWSFHIPGQGWGTQPSGAVIGNATGRPIRADAVAMTLILDSGGGGPTGPLRRVVELPAQP